MGETHTQCMDCHLMKGGAYAGQNPGHAALSITEGPEGPVFSENVDAEHPFNVSHGLCDDCFETRMAPIRAKRAAKEEAERQRQEAEQAKADRAGRKAAQKQAHTISFARGRKAKRS